MIYLICQATLRQEVLRAVKSICSSGQASESESYDLTMVTTALYSEVSHILEFWSRKFGCQGFLELKESICFCRSWLFMDPETTDNLHSWNTSPFGISWSAFLKTVNLEFMHRNLDTAFSVFDYMGQFLVYGKNPQTWFSTPVPRDFIPQIDCLFDFSFPYTCNYF